jgi:hypothetical protein
VQGDVLLHVDQILLSLAYVFLDEVECAADVRTKRGNKLSAELGNMKGKHIMNSITYCNDAEYSDVSHYASKRNGAEINSLQNHHRSPQTPW